MRNVAEPGESLALKIIALDGKPMKSVVVNVRRLGGGSWRKIPAKHIARAVYSAPLPAAKDDFEYHVTAKTASGIELHWPASAPRLNQTVVAVSLR